MRRRIDAAPALAAIVPTDAERACADALRQIARALTHAPGGVAATPLVVKGGTGLALGYGLPRPSNDLDISCAAGVNKERVLDAAVAALGHVPERHFTLVDVKRRGRGYLRLQWEDRHADGSVVTTRTKIDVDAGNPLATPANTVLVDGVRVYALPVLAAMKLDTLTGARPREASRDLYDAAWLLEQYFEEVAPQQRIALWEVHNEILEQAAAWTDKFDDDAVTERSSFDAVWDSLDSSLSCDPVVLQHVDPGGIMVIEEDAAGARLFFEGELFSRQPVGAFEDRAAALLWLERVSDALHPVPAVRVADDGPLPSPGL